MAAFFSSTDFAIRVAAERGTLTLTEHPSRFAGETYIAIGDEVGLIEVALSWAEANARVAAVRR